MACERTETVELDVPVPYGGAEGADDNICAKEFKKRIESKSNGRVAVRLYASEQQCGSTAPIQLDSMLYFL